MRMIKQAKKKTIDVLDGSAVGLDQAGAQLRQLSMPVKSGQAEMLGGDAAEVARANCRDHKQKAERLDVPGILSLRNIWMAPCARSPVK